MIFAAPGGPKNAYKILPWASNTRGMGPCKSERGIRQWRRPLGTAQAPTRNLGSMGHGSMDPWSNRSKGLWIQRPVTVILWIRRPVVTKLRRLKATRTQRSKEVTNLQSCKDPKPKATRPKTSLPYADGPRDRRITPHNIQNLKNAPHKQRGEVNKNTHRQPFSETRTRCATNQPHQNKSRYPSPS